MQEQDALLFHFLRLRIRYTLPFTMNLIREDIGHGDSIRHRLRSGHPFHFPPAFEGPDHFPILFFLRRPCIGFSGFNRVDFVAPQHVHDIYGFLTDHKKLLSRDNIHCRICRSDLSA